MTAVSLISVVGTLDGKPLRDPDGRRAAGRLCTPAESFGTAGAITAVQHANEPVVCTKVGGFYFHQTYEFGSGLREYMIYMNHPRNNSLVYLGTEHGKPIFGEIVTVGPTQLLDEKRDRVIGYFTTMTERVSFLRAAKRLIE